MRARAFTAHDSSGESKNAFSDGSEVTTSEFHTIHSPK
jgi:hypothetical protein